MFKRSFRNRFGAEAESFDDLLIEAMLEQASALKVDWGVVLKADGAAPASADWRKLLRLAAKAATQVKEGLASRSKPALITDPGLLARYELMPMVSELQAEAGRPSRVPGCPASRPDGQTGRTVDRWRRRSRHRRDAMGARARGLGKQRSSRGRARPR